MQQRKTLPSILRAVLLFCMIAALLPVYPALGQSSTVKAPYIGIWLNAQELAALPTSGTAWTALKAAADSSAGTPDIQNQDSNNDVYVLAKALVYARTGEARYRAEVVDQLQRVMGTEDGGRTLALGRNLVSYVIAADLINLPADAAVDQSFRTWLRGVLTENLDGRTLVSTHEDRPNNWGNHAGASRAAAAWYLGDRAQLDRTALVFRGYLGDRAAYASFDYGDDLSWQCDPSKPVGINPKGCVKNGISIDGAQPEEMRRGGSFQWPPASTGYAWEGLQGSIVQAMILTRAGYPAFEWQDKAILRAVQFLYNINWKPASDDYWQVWLVNYAYGTSFPTTSPAKHGKNMGWTDWTHAVNKSGTIQPTAAPTTAPTKVVQPTAAPTIAPTQVVQPTTAPTQQPTLAPTVQPTTAPTTAPTLAPTYQPTAAPTQVVTAVPNPQQPPATGSAFKTITFEDGALVQANTGTDRVVGQVVLANGGQMNGAFSAFIPKVGSAYMDETFSKVDDLYLSFHFKVNSLPSKATRFMLISSDGTTIGNLLLMPNGALRLRNASNTIGKESQPIKANTVYRIGLHQKRGTGGNAVLEAFVVEAGQPFGAPFASTTTGTWTAQAEHIRFGSTTSAVVDAYFDELRLASGMMP